MANLSCIEILAVDRQIVLSDNVQLELDGTSLYPINRGVKNLLGLAEDFMVEVGRVSPMTDYFIHNTYYSDDPLGEVNDPEIIDFYYNYGWEPDNNEKTIRELTLAAKAVDSLFYGSGFFSLEHELNHLGPKHTIIDLGAGDGSTLLGIENRFKSADKGLPEFIGVTLSKSSIPDDSTVKMITGELFENLDITSSLINKADLIYDYGGVLSYASDFAEALIKAIELLDGDGVLVSDADADVKRYESYEDIPESSVTYGKGRGLVHTNMLADFLSQVPGLAVREIMRVDVQSWSGGRDPTAEAREYTGFWFLRKVHGANMSEVKKAIRRLRLVTYENPITTPGNSVTQKPSRWYGWSVDSTD